MHWATLFRTLTSVSLLAVHASEIQSAQIVKDSDDAPAAAGAVGDPSWSRVYIDDPYVRDTAQRILEGAARLLMNERCEAVTSDFVDMRGQPLATKLAELGVRASDYLRIVLFYDGAGRSACKKNGILGYTTPGSRVSYLCGRTFLRAAQRDPDEARAVVIHEMLHSLGLGENPPTSQEITHKVKQRCWR